MKLIKIKRDTIKKNKNAGNTMTSIQGEVRVEFSIIGRLPDHLEHDNSVYITHYDGIITEGILFDQNKISELLKLEFIKISQRIERHLIRHLPEPSYSYTYDNPTLICDACKSEVHLDDIMDEYDDDGWHYTLCPLCNGFNTFEDIEFEKIDTVINELNLKL